MGVDFPAIMIRMVHIWTIQAKHLQNRNSSFSRHDLFQVVKQIMCVAVDQATWAFLKLQLLIVAQRSLSHQPFIGVRQRREVCVTVSDSSARGVSVRVYQKCVISRLWRLESLTDNYLARKIRRAVYVIQSCCFPPIHAETLVDCCRVGMSHQAKVQKC